MALVAGVVLITVSLVSQFLLLLFTLDAHVMAATAAPASFD